MNRFNDNITHKLGNAFYDTGRQLNINRLVNQNIEHKPLVKYGVCAELLFNPYTHYDLHCKMHTCSTSKDSKAEEICTCLDEDHNEDEDHHIQLEHIYNDSLTVHKFDISEERNKMRRDLLKSKEKQKISIKDFLKKN